MVTERMGVPSLKSILLLGLPPALQQELRERLSRDGKKPVFSTAFNQDELDRALNPPPQLIIALTDGSPGAREALAYLERHMLVSPLVVLDPRPSSEAMAELLQKGAADYLGLNQLDNLEAAAVKALNRRTSRQHLLDTSEGRYRLLVETMRDGMMAVDAELSISFVNPALCRMLGYQEQELVGLNLYPLFQGPNREILTKEIAQRQQGQASSYEIEVTTRDGSQLLVFISASPLLDVDGSFLGSMAVYTDQSELRMAEAEVRKAAEEWRQCFNSLEDLVVVIDRHYRVQRCNKAMREYLGKPYSQIVGQPCYRLLHGCDTPPSECLHQRMQVNGKVQTMDYRDSQGRLFVVSASPITDEQGDILGTVHLYKDVTEHRLQEQERVELLLELAKGLEATTMALTNMVDSRDPYTSGHSQRVAELVVMVGSHLGFSEDELTGLKFCGLLHDIGKGAIPLDILNKPGPLTEHERGIINDHPSTAYRILESISFPWPVAQVVYEHHERLDGSGYPQGIKGKEIHPWARLLAVCDVVEAMTSHRPYRPAHGMRDAFQVLEEGSGDKFDPELVQAALASLSVNDRRVTVIDDDPGVLDVYCSFLQRGNYEITPYNDPVRAVEEFAQNPTPILVTDLKMPGKSGLEVLQEVKKAHPDTEVIVVTGHGDKDSVVAAMRMGASDFLEKPVQMAELQKAVDRARKRFNKGS
ncbi:MAG: PAS domain-containing protein [Desulfarculaceae bacterium]|nr:PAS domain-containing protein [Desulfarculaceae bacterium]MCF8072206.1 PAS domain-containing protein [Desulfarculaceae bacterium]MCF8100127.1 PAS domain-containing protein [Desulfarculaceae bacterium]MCF8117224.1 PAS domain-containing protein [Desulfarculaceae bacterium]